MPGSQAAVLKQTPNKVEPKLIPPRGAKPVGVYDDGSVTGAIIYEMEVIDFDAMKKAKKHIKDPATGAPLYRRNNAGQPIVPILRLPKPIKRKKRFVLRAYKSGQVKMLERFRPNEEKTARREENERVEAFSADLAREAIRRGFDNAADMMTALLGGAADGDLAETVAAADSLVADPDALFDDEPEFDDAPVGDLTVEADPAFDADAFNEAKDVASADEGRCTATTNSGERCKRDVVGDTTLCGVHKE